MYVMYYMCSSNNILVNLLLIRIIVNRGSCSGLILIINILNSTCYIIVSYILFIIATSLMNTSPCDMKDLIELFVNAVNTIAVNWLLLYCCKAIEIRFLISPCEWKGGYDNGFEYFHYC